MSQRSSDHGEHHGSEIPTSTLVITLAWLLVGIPLAYGLWQTLVKAFALLSG